LISILDTAHSHFYMLTSSTNPTEYFIILLRHGESIGNAEGKHQGQADFPLTERGTRQAHALAERWRQEKRSFDRVISSPLMRARQTTEIINGVLALPLEFDPLWMERDNGLLAGLTPEDALEIYPRPPFIHPYQAIGGTGESQWELYLRGGRAVQSLLDRPPGKYLIISHGGILNMVLYAILGITPHANFSGPRFRFANTAFASLSYSPGEHKWYVLGINDHLHWSEDSEAS
jgi:2,3-bisphosphoglycerate-dependent phosphoglycerate mutase